MTLTPITYPGYRFPAEIISHAVWLYHVFSLSLRDVELILAERGIVVTHESIRHWCCPATSGTDPLAAVGIDPLNVSLFGW